MRNSDNLYELIQSLGKTEKRYFKMYVASQQGSGDKNYIKLFNAIEKQENYSEENLLEQFKEENFTNNFSAAKKYLFDNILKSLKLYYTDYCISVKIPDALKDMRVLLNKGMVRQALKHYQKAEQIFTVNEQFGGLFDLMTFGEQLWKTCLTNGEAAKKIRALQLQKKQFLKQLDNVNEYQLLYTEIEMMYWQMAPARTKELETNLLQFLDLPLFQDDRQALSLSAKMIYNNCLNLIYLGTANFSELLDNSIRSLDMLQNQEMNEYFTFGWHTTTLHHTLVAATYLEQPETFEDFRMEFEDYLEQFKNRVNLLDSMNGQFRYYHGLLTYHFHNKNYKEVLKLEQFINDHFGNFWDYLKADLRGDVVLILAQTHWRLSNLSLASDYLDKILEQEKEYPKLSQVTQARLLKLFLEIENKNFFLLESLTRSTYRYATKNRTLHQVERSLFKYLKRIAKNHDFELQKNQNNMKKEVKIILQDKYESRFLYSLDLRHW